MSSKGGGATGGGGAAGGSSNLGIVVSSVKVIFHVICIEIKLIYESGLQSDYSFMYYVGQRQISIGALGTCYKINCQCYVNC